MKIRIRDIPAAEREYRFEMDPSQLALAFEGRDDIQCPAHAQVIFFLSRIDTTINLRGTIEFETKITCSRCLKEFASTLTNRIKIVLSKAEPDLEDEEDIGHGYYEGEDLELDTWGVEQISLNLPQVFLCSPDCLGLCPTCGADLNCGSCTCKK